jgi:prevent-host-death family protein
MQTVSLFDAKTHLSEIVEDLVSGKETNVIISRRGKPVVRLAAICKQDVSRRIGLARGQFKVPDNIDRSNSDIAHMFSGKRRSR